MSNSAGWAVRDTAHSLLLAGQVPRMRLLLLINDYNSSGRRTPGMLARTVGLYTIRTVDRSETGLKCGPTRL